MYLIKLNRSQIGEIQVKFEDQRSLLEKLFGFLFLFFVFPGLSLAMIYLGKGFQTSFFDWSFLSYFGFIFFSGSIYLLIITVFQMLFPYSIRINLHEQWLTARNKPLQITSKKISLQNLYKFKYTKKYANIYQLEIELKNTTSIKFKSAFLSQELAAKGCLELNQILGLSSEVENTEMAKPETLSFLNKIESQYEQKSLSLPIQFELGLPFLRKVASGFIVLSFLYFIYNIYKLVVSFSFISLIHSFIVFVIFFKIFSQLSKLIKVKVDDKTVSYECRSFLKTESWAEPLQNYKELILDKASDNKSTKFIQIILVHKSEKQKNVPLSKNIAERVDSEIEKINLYGKLLGLSTAIKLVS